MKAIDTVMSRSEQFKLSPEGAREELCIKQAEITREQARIKERKRLLDYLKSLLKSNSNVSLKEVIYFIESTKPEGG